MFSRETGQSDGAISSITQLSIFIPLAPLKPEPNVKRKRLINSSTTRTPEAGGAHICCNAHTPCQQQVDQRAQRHGTQEMMSGRPGPRGRRLPPTLGGSARRHCKQARGHPMGSTISDDALHPCWRSMPCVARERRVWVGTPREECRSTPTPLRHNVLTKARPDADDPVQTTTSPALRTRISDARSSPNKRSSTAQVNAVLLLLAAGVAITPAGETQQLSGGGAHWECSPAKKICSARRKLRGGKELCLAQNSRWELFSFGKCLMQQGKVPQPGDSVISYAPPVP